MMPCAGRQMLLLQLISVLLTCSWIFDRRGAPLIEFVDELGKAENYEWK